mgnify:CR=1 FL=1|jgi:hypothetical protein|tara:strand:+ start:499 stop:879 length:381 start_codon:yes stop_codon:yes gene_type:complete
MSITAESKRGGIVETIGDASHSFLLRNREIERFEDKHRGIFDLWDGCHGSGKKPTSTEVKDLLALGLVGGGKTDAEADKILKACNPSDLLRLLEIARAVVGIAFLPDAFDEQIESKKKITNQPLAD